MELVLKSAFLRKFSDDGNAAGPGKTLAEGKRPELKREKRLGLYSWHTW